MWSRPQYTELTYMGGTGPCGPMTIIFGSVIQSQYTNLNIKFGVNRTFNVLKTPATDLTYIGGTGPCGPMTIIFGSVVQSQRASLNIKFGVNRTFNVLKTPATDLTYMGGIGPCRPIQPIFNANQRKGIGSRCANFQVFSALRSDAIVFTTDRHSSNVLEFRADQMSTKNLGSQINISTRIDKTL